MEIVFQNDLNVFLNYFITFFHGVRTSDGLPTVPQIRLFLAHDFVMEVILC